MNKSFQSIIYKEVVLDALFWDSFLSDTNNKYNTHLLLESGSFNFLMNDQSHECVDGDFLFWFAGSSLNFQFTSKNCRATLLLIEKDFLSANIPDVNWFVDAFIYSTRFPVKKVNAQEYKSIYLNFNILKEAAAKVDHTFFGDILNLKTKIFVLEMWHLFSNLYNRKPRTLNSGTLFERFVHLLSMNSLTEREVRFYADKLNVTPKHLNHICKHNTGKTASDWIKNYSRENIITLLNIRTLSISEVAFKMNFSSLSFFSRYVKQVIGLSPSDYRQRNSIKH